MKARYIVKESEVSLARDLERKLLDLPPESGVLFVGISVEPETLTLPAIFHIWVGCSRDLDEKMIPALVEVTLRDEIAMGLRVKVQAHRGISRFSKKEKRLEGLLQVPPILDN